MGKRVSLTRQPSQTPQVERVLFSELSYIFIAVHCVWDIPRITVSFMTNVVIDNLFVGRGVVVAVVVFHITDVCQLLSVDQSRIFIIVYPANSYIPRFVIVLIFVVISLFIIDLRMTVRGIVTVFVTAAVPTVGLVSDIVQVSVVGM